MSDQAILSELARVKAVFQLRAIAAHISNPHPSAGYIPVTAHGRPGSVSSLDAAGAYPLAGDHCRSCREILCSCPDAVFAGVAPAIGPSLDEEHSHQAARVGKTLFLRSGAPSRVIDQSNHEDASA